MVIILEHKERRYRNEVVLGMAITVSFLPITSAKEAIEGGCVLHHISLCLMCIRREPQCRLGTSCGVAWLKKLYLMRDNQTNHRHTHGNLIWETKYEVGIRKN